MKANGILDKTYKELARGSALSARGIFGIDPAGQKFLVQVRGDGAAAMHPSARPKAPSTK